MDLREIKTQRSIRNAFLQLRSEKPLERIRVKELAELAEISKGTFYLHYHDVYDLSEQLQNEVIENVISFALSNGFSVHHLEYSPIKGPEGNIEYLVHIEKATEPVKEESVDIPAVVCAAHGELDK